MRTFSSPCFHDISLSWSLPVSLPILHGDHDKFPFLHPVMNVKAPTGLVLASFFLQLWILPLKPKLWCLLNHTGPPRSSYLHFKHVFSEASLNLQFNVSNISQNSVVSKNKLLSPFSKLNPLPSSNKSMNERQLHPIPLKEMPRIT